MRVPALVVVVVAALLLLVACTSGSGGGDEGVTDASSSGVGSAGAGSLVLPPANGQIDYQLGGAYDPDPAVRIVTRDRTADPVPGRYNVCYVNAFQSQPDEMALWTDDHPDLLLRNDKGAPLADPGYPDEYLFDLTTPAKRQAVATIVGAWIQGCADDGFQAVEGDNLDAWTRSKGSYGEDEALAYASSLTAAAHAAGLPMGQKNAGDLGTKGRDAGFDFAVAEECQVYEECGDYTDVYGDQVYEIEYTDNGVDAYAAACADHGDRISVILRDRDVVPRGAPGYVYQAC